MTKRKPTALLDRIRQWAKRDDYGIVEALSIDRLNDEAEQTIASMDALLAIEMPELDGQSPPEPAEILLRIIAAHTKPVTKRIKSASTRRGAGII